MQKKFQSSTVDETPELFLPTGIKQKTHRKGRFPRCPTYNQTHREILKATRAVLAHNSIDFKPCQQELDTWWEALSTTFTVAQTFISLIKQLHTFRDFHTLTVHHYYLLQTPKIPSKIWFSITTRSMSESIARTCKSRCLPRNGNIPVRFGSKMKALYLKLTDTLTGFG